MTSRQFYMVFAISVITMKMQKLACLVFSETGKDAWLMFIFYLAANLIGIIISYLIVKTFKKYTKSANYGLNFKNNNIFGKILNLFATFYFLMHALLLYEHIQNLFTHTLFDNFSWAFFGVLLLFAVFFLSHTGIKNIARNFEIYVWLVVSSMVLIAVLGVPYTDFSGVLPFETIKISNILSKMRFFYCWFGDFFIVLFLGRYACDIKLSKTIFVYVLSMVFVSFMVVELIGQCGEYAAVEPGMISVISEPAILGLNLGRFDWFLILFSEIGAVLSCSVYIFFSKKALCDALPKVKPIFIEIILAIIMYYFDVFYFSDINAKIQFYFHFMNYFSIAFELIVILFFVIWLNYKKIYKNQKIKKGKLLSEKDI